MFVGGNEKAAKSGHGGPGERLGNLTMTAEKY